MDSVAVIDAIISLLPSSDHVSIASQEFFRSQCLAMQDLYDEMRSTYYAVRYFDKLQELAWPDLDTVLSTMVIQVGFGFT